MKFHQRLAKLEQQKALDDEERWLKLKDYFERAPSALAIKLGVPTYEVTMEVMAENGDPLAQLIIQIRRRIEGSSYVFDLA